MDTGVVVSDSNGVNENANRARTRIDYVPLRSLAVSHPQTYQDLVELLREVEGGLVGKVIDFDWTDSGKYIKNVVTFRSDGERDAILEYLREQGVAFKRNLFGFTTDTDHIHVLHDCPLAGGTCKCYWRSHLPAGKLVGGYGGKQRLADLDGTDWCNAFLYYFFAKRGQKNLWLGRTNQRLESGGKYSLSFIFILMARFIYR